MIKLLLQSEYDKEAVHKAAKRFMDEPRLMDALQTGIQLAIFEQIMATSPDAEKIRELLYQRMQAAEDIFASIQRAASPEYLEEGEKELLALNEQLTEGEKADNERY